MHQLLQRFLSIAGVAAGLTLAAVPAHAVYTITLTETGGKVVATGTGTINTTGLTSGGNAGSCMSSFINPTIVHICLGIGSQTTYTGVVISPGAFGTGNTYSNADSQSGDSVILYNNSVYIQTGYVSGSALSSTSTWNGKTFATLGITPGTYTWTLPNDTIVLTTVAAVAATPVVLTPPPIPNNVVLPGISGIGSQLAVLDLTSGSGPSMTTCLVDAIKQLFRAEASYVGQSANGAAQILVGGQTISFYPLEASTGTGLGVGAFPRNDNPLTVGTSCGTFGVAPAVANIADLGRALAALGLDVQVDAKGVFTAMVDNQLYVVRPDYFVTQGIATGTPSLVFGADGVLRFTDSAGKEQILHPAFLDPAALQAAVVAALGQYGYLTIQTDGSGVFTRFNGSQLVLTPEMVLSGAPNGFGSAKVVNDGLNRYLYLIAAYYQGVTATAR